MRRYFFAAERRSKYKQMSNCYTLSIIYFKRTWSEARKYCYAHRMHLVTLYSREKQDCLFSALKGF